MIDAPKPDNPPAFPVHGGGYIEPAPAGMTLRDYMAAHALIGLLACPATQGCKESFARFAYDYADALLAARAKGCADD